VSYSVTQIRFGVLTQMAQIFAQQFFSCGQIYECETPGYVILWKPWQIHSWIWIHSGQNLCWL